MELSRDDAARSSRPAAEPLAESVSWDTGPAVSFPPARTSPVPSSFPAGTSSEPSVHPPTTAGHPHPRTPFAQTLRPSLSPTKLSPKYVSLPYTRFTGAFFQGLRKLPGSPQFPTSPPPSTKSAHVTEIFIAQLDPQAPPLPPVPTSRPNLPMQQPQAPLISPQNPCPPLATGGASCLHAVP